MQYHGTTLRASKIPWKNSIVHQIAWSQKHVLDLNHLWIISERRLTLTIPSLRLNWGYHIHPLSPRSISWLYRWVTKVMHALPGLTTICPFTCKQLHNFFSCVFMVTTPSLSVASSTRFYMLAFLLIFYHVTFVLASNLVIDSHIKRIHLPNYMGPRLL